MALRNIGANFEHYKIAEWEVSAFKSYKAIHMTNDDTDYSQGISKGELTQILFDYGISTNGKDPMTIKEIQRKNEKWLRETYNNIKATNNLCSICNFKGEDLEIVDIDSFTYLLTYSFPCQDLSVAGKMKGMAKGSGTRSGLLWEVERLLNEVENLPQVLLMENVPQVIGKKNIDNFHLWQQFLEDKGYSNYTEILNAKNYGVAQNRERCFMVSLLGEWNYNFPKQIPLTKTMKDYLEDEVDEKYYIKSEKAQKLIQQLVDSKQLKNDTECVDGSVNDPKTKEISNCIKARYDAGISNFKSDGGMVVEVKVIGQMDNTIDHTFESANRVYDKEGLSPTINTCGGGGLQPKVIVASRGRNPDNPSDRKQGIELEQRLEPNSEGICNCITTVTKDNMVLEPKRVSPNRTHNMSNTRIYNIWRLMKRRCNSSKAPNYKYYGGRGIKVCSKWNSSFESFYEWAMKNGYSEQLSLDRIDNDKDYSPDNCKWSTHVEQVNNRRNYGETPYYGIVRDNTGYRAQVTVNGKKKYIAHSVDDIEYLVNKRNKYIDEHSLPNKKNAIEPKLVGGLGEKDWGKQWRQGNRVYDADAIAMALNASPVGNAGGNSYLYKTDYRIRKLTPKECWRLMAFTDEDFHKAEQVNSNTQLYKQAGNSIVVKVLEAIFKQML